jgi:hypothetical protein
VSSTQLDEPPAPRKVARPMFSFLRRRTPASVVPPVRAAAAAAPVATPLVREPADRSLHQDDQHLVFWNADASQASATHLSKAAGTWQQAVSK